MMRPTHELGGHTLREITMWKAIVFSILTLGIYYLVVTYQNSKDIHEAAGKDPGIVVVLFILGIFFAIPMLILYALNGAAFHDLQRKAGRDPNSTWIIALVLTVLLGPLGAIVWAVHFNSQLQIMAA